MTTELVFADPPEPTGSGADAKLARWTDRITQLAEHPNEWVDAGATWDVTYITKRSPAYKAAADLGAAIEVRNVGGGSKNGSKRTCFIRVVA